MTPDQQPVSFFCQAPPPPLANFVGLFWYWRGYETSQAIERILPSGSTEVVFNLRDGTGVLGGPRSGPFFIRRAVSDEFLGIHFKPGGAAPFFKAPISEFHNQHHSIRDIWTNAPSLAEALHLARGVPAKFDCLGKWLLRSGSSFQQHRAISCALRSFQDNPALSSAAVANATGLSQRRFIQLFENAAGLAPKLFCRVLRFQQMLKSIGPNRRVDWAEAALHAGYYDQAHFIHDFREFSGLAPTEYLELRTPHLNHVKTG